MSRIIYLHGFASGPTSKKAQFFRDRFAQLGIGLEIPDLADGKFERLTITGQLGVIERVARDEPVTLLGSSMGGYLAALFAAQHTNVKKLMLMAPAFCFSKRWPQALGQTAMEEWRLSGVLKVFHYSQGRTVELGYQLIEDGRQYEDYPAVLQPTLIFHGVNDTVVPADLSVEFAKRHPQAQLHRMNSDHELLNVLEEMWMETERFLFGDHGSAR